MRKEVLWGLLLAVVILPGSWTLSGAMAQKDSSGISAVKPILVQNCALPGCHRAGNPTSTLTGDPAALLRLERDRFPASVLDVPSTELPGLKLVDTKDPEKSYLLAKIKGEPGVVLLLAGVNGIVGGRMPLNRAPLSAKQIQEVEAWISSLKKSQ
jgi:hypothetical protein